MESRCINQRCTQVSNVKSHPSLKSLGASLKSFRSSRKSIRKSFTSSLKSQPTLSSVCFCNVWGVHSRINYMTQICIIRTHPTHMTYCGDALVNETNTIPPSTILKISLSQSAYLLFILQLYHEHKGPTKLPSKICTPTNH